MGEGGKEEGKEEGREAGRERRWKNSKPCPDGSGKLK
jgi:hypothetical protein